MLLDLFAPVLRPILTSISKSSLPKTSGQVTLNGISSPVEILRDRWGVPHIYAKTVEDSQFGLGYAHAQDRLFQMDLNRRTACGKLSELFGKIALDTDRAARTFGFSRLGLADFPLLEKSTQECINAYIAGVNAYLGHASFKLPVEYRLLGTKPEPWVLEDSMAFSRLMFWQLSHAWYSEIVRSKLIDQVGSEKAAEWEIRYPTQNPTILPKGVEFTQLGTNGSIASPTSPLLQRSQGSNCWVVSGERSATGKPILCNDMHLVLTLPTIWYEAHTIAHAPNNLNETSYNMSGVTMPGIPFTLVGHNERIGWGITLAFTDCEDLFIEKVDSEGQNALTPDGWKPLTLINEQIKIKGGTFFTEPVKISRHGPIISDVVDYPEQKVAVQSMALQPTAGLTAWHHLNSAKNWDEFSKAISQVNATQLNIGYADVEGNIGYYLTGQHPIRGKGDGKVPAPGWDADYDWQGSLPFSEIPHALNPEQGFVVTCNNKIISDSFPHFLGDVWMNGYRAQRLSDLLETNNPLKISDCKKMQQDDYCIPAGELVRALADFKPVHPRSQAMLDLLRTWDQHLSTATTAGTIYEVVRYHLVRNLLVPVLGVDFTTHLLGISFNPILLTDHEFFGYDTISLLRMLDQKDSWWLEQAGGRDELLENSFKAAGDWLTDKFGHEMDNWQWGKLHQLTFAHALGSQKPLDKIFNRGPIPIAGDTDTPLQSAMNPGDPFDNKLWSPSVRFIMDMSDLTKSEVITPVGQSGQLGSSHYDDFIKPFMEGGYHPMLWIRKDIEANLEGKLTLIPSGNQG